MKSSMVYLRPLAEGDAEAIVKWRNDPVVGSQMFALRGPKL